MPVSPFSGEAEGGHWKNWKKPQGPKEWYLMGIMLKKDRKCHINEVLYLQKMICNEYFGFGFGFGSSLVLARLRGDLMKKKYSSFDEFYEFYLSQHQNIICRRLHFFGLVGVFLSVLFGVITSNYIYFLLTPVIGYGMAWIGHFVFEKNRPATFDYFLYSFMGDFRMFFDILRRRIPF